MMVLEKGGQPFSSFTQLNECKRKPDMAE